MKHSFKDGCPATFSVGGPLICADAFAEEEWCWEVAPPSGDNHMRYSDDEGDGMGNHDDLDDLDGGTGMQPQVNLE